MAGRAERIEKAARALGDRIDDMTNDYVGVNEGGTTLVSDSLLRDLIAGANALRAALALPADAAGSAEAVRAACAAVPALEEARRRRLRWADEAHAQILAVPAPAQPAPEGAGEAGGGVDYDQPDMCDEYTLLACADINVRVPTDNGGISPTLGAVARTALHYLKCAATTPRAEAASAEAVREACVAAVDREAGALEALIDESDDLPRWQAQKMPVVKKLREVASMLRSLPLPSAPASAEAVAREAALNACELIAGNPVLLTSDAVDAIVDRAVAHALRAKGAR